MCFSPRFASTLVRFTIYPLLAFLLPVALSFWAASRLTRGIDAVAAHADAVARGGLRRELGFTSGDEVGQLARRRSPNDVQPSLAAARH